MKAERFSAVASRLEGTLGRCEDAPEVGAIHHVRTGSRRLEAALEGLERETRGSAALCKSAAKLRKLLKRMRRRAGVVRDLDVHRGLLQKMVAEGKVGADRDGGEGIGGEIGRLDAELERRREGKAAKFQQRAGCWREKLKERSAAVVEAALEAGDPPAGVEAGDLAQESFAALCGENPILDAGNLHAFRKGAKRARYIAEGGEDVRSRRTAQRLKRVQDAIGMWHDWVVLCEEARESSGGEETELVKRIEARCERQFWSAMKTTERARRELLGEWQGNLKKRVNRGADSARAGLARTA